jgi:hypothetical protein
MVFYYLSRVSVKRGMLMRMTPDELLIRPELSRDRGMVPKFKPEYQKRHYNTYFVAKASIFCYLHNFKSSIYIVV